MNKYRSMLLLSAICLSGFSLSACSTLENQFGIKPAAHSDKIDVTNTNDDSHYDAVAQEMSGTDVHVYSLDNNAASTGLPEAAAKEGPQKYQTIRSVVSEDSSVTVYPFDGGTMVEAAHKQSMPQPTAPIRLAPPTGNAQAPSQDGGMGQPLSWQPQERQSHKIAPSRIYFAHDSVKLTPSGHEVVGHVVKDFQQGEKLSVEGHASPRAEQKNPIERKIVNLKVSMERALSVSRALMLKGVPADAITTKAYGDTRPPMISGGMDPNAAARRVDIYEQ